jgi:hypothetical protein
MNVAKLDVALHYASLGIPVFPLHFMTPGGSCSCGGPVVNPKCKPGKHPFGSLVPHGLKDATNDKTIIRKWIAGNPYNIGICTGEVSGFFVLDRDDKDGGDVALAELENQNTTLPKTLTQTTGNGKHYLFRMPATQRIKSSSKIIGAGLDIRGTGGYIVAPPSVHENGRTYAWDDCQTPTRESIADAPTWLLKAIEITGTKPIAITPFPTPNPSATNLMGGFYWPNKISDGEGREDFILRAAGHLHHKGETQANIERTLLDYNTLHISPPLSDDIVLDRARRYPSTSQAGAANDVDWDEPQELRASLPPVPKFDNRMLPKVFHNWVYDIGDQMQCPIEFLAVGVMVAAGSVVGNRMGVQPKRHDTGWVEVPNIWGAVVGRPGVMKSPALAKVLAPLKKLERDAQAAHKTAQAQFEIDKMQFTAAKKLIEDAVKKGATVLPSQMPIEPIQPEPKRYLLGDSTYQKLGAVLSGNPHGVLVFQDELSGLLMRLETSGQESSRGFYLEAWDGKQSYVFDRIERGTVQIPKLCFSLLGGLQPSKLREYLRSAVYGGKGDDGLSQRLQMLVYPDITNTWTRVDRLPDHVAADAAEAVFDRLANLDPVALGARMPLGDGIPVLCFDDNAQALFNTWWTKLEGNLRTGDNHPSLESHLSKYRKLVPAIALLDHLISGRHGDITIKSVGRAIIWQEFLLEHAKRAYAAVTSATMDSAQALSKHIQGGALKDGFTIREVYRHNWSLLCSVKEATEAAEVLVDMGWLRAVQDPRQGNSDGRAAIRYYVNPHLRAAA